MTSEKPLISVVIPVHNEAQWLPDCMRCMFAQTYPNLEFIIVDDGSRDDSFVVAQRFSNDPRVKIVRFETNKGEGAARGAGLETAEGEYVIQVDADALFPPDFVEKAFSYFERDPDLWAVSLGYLTVHPGIKGVVADYFRVKREASRIIRFVGGKEEIFTCFMYRKAILGAVGNYDASLPGGVDLDLGKRIRKAGLKHAWAKDVYFEHADPSSLLIFLRRTFNQSFYWRKAYERWGMWPKGLRVVPVLLRAAFVSLAPLYALLGAAFHPAWFLVLAASLALESVSPIIFDKESRLALRLAVLQKRYALAILFPVILFLRLRASSYGKTYAILFPEKTEKAVTFDV